MIKCFTQYQILLAGERVNWPSKTAKFLSSRCDETWQVDCYSPHDLPVIRQTLSRQGVETGTSEAWRIAHRLWKIAGHGLASMNQKLELSPISETLPADTRALYAQAELFMRFVESLATYRATGSNVLAVEKHEGLTLAGDQYSCALLYEEDQAAFIMPFEAVLMFKDMLLARANVYLGVHVIYQGDSSLRSAVDAVLFWQEECLYRYDNPGYEVLKQIEPLAKAYVIHSCDPLLGNHPEDVFYRIKQKVVTKERSLGATAPYQADALEDIFRRTPDIKHIIELFGLQRLTGHPLIDPAAGGLSAAEEASKPSRTTYLAAKRLRNNWCRLYLEGFVRRSSQWPDLVFTAEGRKTQLYQLYKTRDRDLTRDSYKLEEWDHVRFGKHQEFDYYTNFTDLMDDKSISYYRDEFRATWDRTVKPRSHKRLLIEMLSREEISIRSIIERVESGTIPWYWYIVSLYPKEREFKLEARMFSMMPFEMRAFFASLEANIADHIFPNMPQQTMTLGRTEIMERFFNLSRPLSAPNRRRLFIEVDLSRWNLRWRDMVMRLIGMDLDDIFGTNGRYVWVHEYFKRCLINVRVQGYEPPGLHDPDTADPHPMALPGEPPQSALLWYNHEGGFEGIVQKDWTIATYSMVDLGLAGYDLEYSLLGQGDNQVVLATVSIPPVLDEAAYLRDLASRIKESISISCASVGQEAKEEECLESTEVVTYSKDFYVKGSEFFLSLKAVSRIFPRGASDFPTVSNGLAAITSSSIAAAERMKQPLLGFFLSVFHSARYLIRIRGRPTVEGAFIPMTLRSQLTEDMIGRLLTIPGSVGGLPIAPLCSFLYKGGGDPGARDYLSLKIMYRGGLAFLGRVNEALLSGAWRPAEVDPSQLLEDPYAIPIRRVSTAENRVLKLSLKNMLRKTKNKAIRGLIEQSVEDYDEELKASLMSVSPFNPTLLSDLRSFSIVGAREMAMRMFTVTRTVQGLSSHSDEDPGGSILFASSAELREILHKLNHLPPSGKHFGDVYQAMVSLRRSWKTEEWKEEIVGVSSYPPLDWEVLIDDEVSEAEGILLSYSPSENPWYTRGSEDPYLGTDTREKRTKHGYKIVTSSAAEKAFARLATIATQPGVSSSFVSLVCQIAETRSAVPLDRLLPFLSQAVGGSIAHRYQATLGNRGASVLGCGTVASHISINSDHAGVLSASLLDYPVMFQEAFCGCISFLNLLILKDPSSHHYIRIRTPPVLEALPEDVVSAKYAPSHRPILLDNPIAYCQDLLLWRMTRPLETVLSSPVMTSDLAGISPSRIAYQAAYRQLLNRHTAHLIADLGYGAIRLPLDLLEYRGLGLENVVTGVSVAIARFSIDAMFSRSTLDLRWNPMPVIWSLSASFGVHLLRAARHPLFSDDPYVAQYLSSTQMAYNRAKELDTVVGMLVSLVLANIDQVSSLHTDLVELIFDDDQEEIPLLRAESIIKRIALRAVIREEITAQEGYLIARRNLVQAVRHADTAGGKSKGLYHLACSISEWAASEGKYALAEEAGALAEGKLIKRVYRSQLQVLRTMRGRVQTARAQTSQVLDAPRFSYQRIYCEDPQPVVTIVEEDIAKLRLSRDYWSFHILRRSVRKYGKHSPSVYSFWPIVSLLKGQNVVVIGAGNGGASEVAIAAGAASLVLHDLAVDLSIEEIAQPARKKGTTLVYRSKASVGRSGGDIRKDETWVSLAEDLIGYRIIILDVQIPWADFQEVISRLSSHSPGSLLVTRWIVSPERARLILPTLSKVTGYSGIIPIFAHEGHREFLAVHRIEWSGAWRPYAGNTSPISSSLPDYEGISRLGGGREWNMVTFRGARPAEIQKMLSLSLQAIGKTKHSFTYTQWTHTLRVLLGAQLDSDSSWVDTIVSLVSKDIAIIETEKGPLSLNMSEATRRWLTVDYPRTRA